MGHEERVARLLRSREPAGSAHELRYCFHCERDVLALRPNRLWRYAAPIAAVGIVAALFAVMLIGPFALIAILPVTLFAMGMSPVIAEMRAHPRCPTCSRDCPYHTREEALTAHAAPAEHAPA